MPHLTVQISSGGPILDILVAVSKERSKAIQKAKLPLPDPIRVRGLVDTGASSTCIENDILNKLGLSPTGQAMMHTPSTGQAPYSAAQFDIGLVLLHQKISLALHTVPVIAADLKKQGIQALIGRDVLGRCLLVYDGPAALFALAF